ncbi:hypothetical protein VTO42DRAFT_2255 [Malbranchea cinnamomea]
MRPLPQSLVRPYICSSCRQDLRICWKRFASTKPAVPEIYDIVCVGGGPAGLALLAALRSSPVTSKLKVALVETQDLSKARSWSLDPSRYSNRVSSLTPSTVSFLRDIGAWQHVDTSRVQPYEEMEVWDGTTGSKISFDWATTGLRTNSSSSDGTIATMTENANLVRGLLERIYSLGEENLSIFSNTTVDKIENGVDYQDGPDLSAWPVLTLAPSAATANPGHSSTIPGSIAARLLVGADGINSPVRRFADIYTDGWDYHRHGVVASLDLSSDPSSSSSSLRPRRVTAYQRFLPDLGGPVALLPLPNNHATLVWSTTVENATYLKSLAPESFVTMVNAAFRLSMADLKYMLSLPHPPSPSEVSSELSWRLQHTPLPSHVPPLISAVQPNTIASFPLRHRHALSYISPRVALIGDAAHVVHPLGGLGLNLGIGDVQALHRAIEYACTHGMDVGDVLSLERYAAERWVTNAKIGAGCDLLHKLYNVPGNGPVAWGRSIGLDIVDRVPLLKGLFMKMASGA